MNHHAESVMADENLINTTGMFIDMICKDIKIQYHVNVSIIPMPLNAADVIFW